MGRQSRQIGILVIDKESMIPRGHLLRKIDAMISYVPQQDAFICPEGKLLTYHRLNCNKSTEKYLRCYQVKVEVDCVSCPRRSTCFDKTGIRRRILASSCYPAFFRGHSREGTAEYMYMMRLRKIWARAVSLR